MYIHLYVICVCICACMQSMKWTKKGLHEEGMFEGHEYEEGANNRQVQDDDDGGTEDEDEETSRWDCSPIEEAVMADEAYNYSDQAAADANCPDGSSQDGLDDARQFVQAASLLVGLHPDQAAESIVRFATNTRKPFAIVPCCVYSNEPQFRARRLRDGTRVTSYEHLLR